MSPPRRARTWITDMRHYLDEHGSLPADMPGPAVNLALFLGSIVTNLRTAGIAALALDYPHETSSSEYLEPLPGLPGPP